MILLYILFTSLCMLTIFFLLALFINMMNGDEKKVAFCLVFLIICSPSVSYIHDTYIAPYKTKQLTHNVSVKQLS